MEKETAEIKQENDKLYELIRACNDLKKPNSKARVELQKLVNKSEVAKSFMESQEDLYNIAIRNRIENFASSDSFKEVARTKCRLLCEQLGYSEVNMLEKLAIQQIVLTWLNYYQTELLQANMMSPTVSIESGIYWEKRLTFALRRYQKALETLSRMRKMNLTLQINNSDNQIVNNKL